MCSLIKPISYGRQGDRFEPSSDWLAPYRVRLRPVHVVELVSAGEDVKAAGTRPWLSLLTKLMVPVPRPEKRLVPARWAAA